MPLKQSVKTLVGSLFPSFAAFFAVLSHLARHFAFDVYVTQWGFVELAFGFASWVWYRQVLSKAAMLEGGWQKN
jgi:hypothetical protein